MVNDPSYSFQNLGIKYTDKDPWTVLLLLSILLKGCLFLQLWFS
jgi:hypothetical protein